MYMCSRWISTCIGSFDSASIEISWNIPLPQLCIILRLLKNIYVVVFNLSIMKDHSGLIMFDLLHYFLTHSDDSSKAQYELYTRNNKFKIDDFAMLGKVRDIHIQILQSFFFFSFHIYM